MTAESAVLTHNIPVTLVHISCLQTWVFVQDPMHCAHMRYHMFIHLLLVCFTAHQPSASGGTQGLLLFINFDCHRQRNRGVNQQGGSHDRSEGMLNRGSSAEGRDRFPRQGSFPRREGSSEHSDQQDRFGPRRFNRDTERNRDMGRNRRIDRLHPGKEGRPMPATRQPSANSTVSASRGADGRIEIAAEPGIAPNATPLVTAEAGTAGAKSQPKLSALKPTPLPAESSPTSPLPLAADPIALEAGATSVITAEQSMAAAEIVPADRHSDSPHVGSPPNSLAQVASATIQAPAAEAASQEAAKLSPTDNDVLPTHTGLAAPAAELPGVVATSHLTIHPASAESSHTNGPVTPQSASHSPLAIPSMMQSAQHAQHAAQQPGAPRQPHVLQQGPVSNLAAATGPVNDPGAPQMPPHAAQHPPPLQASAALHQAPPFRPKASPGNYMGTPQLPNGYAGPQQHQHPSGPQSNILANRMRTFPPQQQQQQPLQQLPRRQPDKGPIHFVPGQAQGHPHSHNPVMSPHMQAHAAASQAAEPGHPVAGQGTLNGPQGRSVHLPQPHQPGSGRSSSTGQKRPMPNQEPQHAPPHQLTPPQQQRGQATPSGPPTMGHLPFNGQMHPASIPHYMSSPNGMPPNVSMPVPRGPNGMHYPLLQRPSMINPVMMTPVNMALEKSGPMHHQGGLPYGANPYMASMGQMSAPISSSALHSQAPNGPHPQPHPQLQVHSPGGHPGPSFTPPQRTVSLASSLPNGHTRANSGPGLSPASSLGNAASKASSTLRATALPFVPGGTAQPASPLSAQPTAATAQHGQALQQGPRHLQSGPGMASAAAPFHPGSDVAGESSSTFLHACLSA